MARATDTSAPATIGVVLVNWNRWPDTIEALESLLRSDVPLKVIVVDNASSDGSLDRIVAWAEGTQPADAASLAMAGFSQPPLPKPVAFRRVAAADLATSRLAPEERLVLVDSGGNLGFAGGNNVGLRLLLADPDIGVFWLLNNDTVVAPDTARQLGLAMAADAAIGMCGTKVRYYWTPANLQVANGYRFSFITGGGKGINWNKPADAPLDAAAIAADTDFVIGASLAVTRLFLETIGLMEERYFLYYEEIDWAVRARGRFATGFAPAATVWHKEGGTIGSSSVKGGRSVGADYWHNRSRLRFIALHRPWLLPWHWLFTVGIIGRRLARRQPAKARAIWKALLGQPLN